RRPRRRPRRRLARGRRRAERPDPRGRPRAQLISVPGRAHPSPRCPSRDGSSPVAQAGPACDGHDRRMRFDLMTAGLPLRRMQQLARDAEAAGFSGLVITESGRTAYLSCAVAATTSELELLTGVAVAFPRSPMVTASVAWELAEASGGRFRLGLGTQVRAHIERRYGTDF